ncbi:putative eukaryotic translation initiation factor 3 subunit CLU1/TIF31 [Histomonas meleagridis]|uniref:putative eukaryotic translation initiation factor 3 subunit CLU1/TIF31 n=1 Tax=Histomonas meleagridis TaxID=135588 RepID=UPI003559A5E2|nr:putative eukaryotic translation initiation factor 3 subunit CLU1/TIF31 [Histomonas meleagridis]KAH0801561.1 putative eukaryotic translation initiation factor 3 subunit CLU1/TIF31 [Histomonas meleagridis]
MQPQNESNSNPIKVSICAPGIEPVKFTMSSPDISVILSVINNSSELCYFTNFELATKSGIAPEGGFDLSKDIVNNELVIHIRVLPYNELSVVQHVQQLCRIIFTLTSRNSYTDCSQSIVGWLIRKFQNKYPTVEEIDGFYPEGLSKTYISRLIKFIDYDTTSLTTVERLSGLILKLKVTTTEKKDFIIYADKDGFFTQDSKHYIALHQLLCQISKSYNSNSELIFEKWCSLMTMEKLPFSPIEKPQIFSPVYIKGDKPKIFPQLEIFKVSQSQDFLCSLDDAVDGAEEESLNYSYIKSIENSYIKRKIFEGISLIKRGYINPITDSNNYLYYDLFITRLSDLSNFYENKGGIESADRTIQNEVRIYSDLTNIENSQIRVTRTFIVDYFTERWNVQCLIPGLINHSATITYGFKPENKEEFVTDERFVEFFDKHSKELNISESYVKYYDKPIKSSSEVNGVIGSDGKLYLIDMHRTTPRDANFPDPVKHHGYLIRREAIRLFEIYKALEQNSKVLIELGGSKELQYHHKDPNASKEEKEKLEQKIQEIIDNRETILYDINALTIDSKTTEIPKNILEISEFIINVSIPRFVNEFLTSKVFIMDGQHIVDEMHNHGINARYLGKVNEYLNKSNSPIKDIINVIIESEMISRSFKVYVRRKQSSLDEFLILLNDLLGFNETSDETFNIIRRKSEEKFNWKPSKPNASQRTLIIRSILKAFGITIISRNFDTKPIEKSDIIAITPCVKYTSKNDQQIQNYINFAITFYNNGNIEQSYQLFNVAAQLGEQSLHTFDPLLSIIYFYLSMIELTQKNYELAQRECVKSLLILERYYDQTHPEIIIRYSLMADIMKAMGNSHLAFAFAARAALLSYLLCPFYQWAPSALLLAIENIIATEPKIAIIYLQKALEMSETTKVTNEFKAQILHLMAIASFNDKNELKKTAVYLERALEMDPENEEIKKSLTYVKEELKRPIAKNVSNNKNKNKGRKK